MNRNIIETGIDIFDKMQDTGRLFAPTREVVSYIVRNLFPGKKRSNLDAQEMIQVLEVLWIIQQIREREIKVRELELRVRSLEMVCDASIKLGNSRNLTSETQDFLYKLYKESIY